MIPSSFQKWHYHLTLLLLGRLFCIAAYFHISRDRISVSIGSSSSSKHSVWVGGSSCWFSFHFIFLRVVPLWMHALVSTSERCFDEHFPAELEKDRDSLVAAFF